MPPAERVGFWDLLRGVAVLGILLANIPYMSMAGAIASPDGWFVGGDGWLDHACFHAVYVLADTKFITLFSLLFGIGLGAMAERARAAATPSAPRTLRRLGLLLVFGVLHAAFVWFGDVLAFYALVGAVALPLAGLSVVTLIATAAVLLAVNLALWVGFAVIDPLSLVDTVTLADGTHLDAAASIAHRQREYAEVFAHGTLAEQVRTRLLLFGGSLPAMLAILGLRTLALLLIGMALVRTRVAIDLAADRAGWRRLACIAIPAGLLLQLVSAAALAHRADGAAPRVLQFATLYLGGLGLAFGYAGLVALWSLGDVLAGLKARLAAVGRMALTSYLSHGVIAGIVFTAFGQFDRWRRPQLLLLVLAIFTFQLWFAPWWLRRFRYGPIEWLWRAGTYLRRP